MKGVVGAAVGCQRRLAAVAEHEVLVGHRRLRQGESARRQHAAVGIEVVDRLRIEALDHPTAGVEFVEALHLVRLVILRVDAQRLGLHSQVRVLRHQHDRAGRLLGFEGERAPQDPVVGGVLQEGVVEVGRLTSTEYHPDRAEPLAKRTAFKGEDVAGERVEPAEKLAGLEVDVFVAAFELVEFLEHRDRHGHVVLGELPQAAAVVKDHIRVEHEELGSGVSHRSSSERSAAIPASPHRTPPAAA